MSSNIEVTVVHQMCASDVLSIRHLMIQVKEHAFPQC